MGFALDWESHKSLKHDRECLTELPERQWCAGSGFWSPIQPDIWNFLDLDWIGYRFLFNRIRIIQMK